METLVFDDHASPTEAEQRDERGVDEPAQRADEEIVGRVENALMKAQIRAYEIAAPILKALHVRVGFGDARKLPFEARRGGIKVGPQGAGA